MKRFLSASAVVAVVCGCLTLAGAAPTKRLPIIVPLTGFLALEGASQRDGALLAVKDGGAAAGISSEVFDAATSPETAVNVLQRALDGGNVMAVVGSMLGTQMLAMMPLAQEAKVPILTISGTAKITELNNPFVFRFFPGDTVAKVAQARYVVDVLKKRRVAVLYQSDAYGQGGEKILGEQFRKLAASVVLSESVDTATKDLLPILLRVKSANADVLVTQLHSESTALSIRQANSMGLNIPMVEGSAIGQPATAALFPPEDLKNVCGETASSPVASNAPKNIAAFTAAYRAAFHTDPDAFAVAQYDGTMMMLHAVAHGATTPEAVVAALGKTSYDGLAMRYRSDGHGNMAHTSIIICFDGKTRTPRIAKMYDIAAGSQ